MASIYYGKSNTAANEATKVVVCPSALDDGRLLLQHGDLLVVLFQHKNDISGPLLLVANDDSNVDVNENDANGLSIKVQSNPIDLIGAWTAGETKIFIYTLGEHGEYYFALVGSVKGDSETFGNVKVVDSGDQTAIDGVAISPAGAQNLIDQSSGLTLNWDGPTEGDNIRLLGDLGLRKNGTLLTTIPIYQYYPNIHNYTYTNEFYNNGPKSDGTPNNKHGYGHPFLTYRVPGRVTLYPDGRSVGIYYLTRNMSTDTLGNTEELVFELSDANGHTNIFGTGNLTLQARQGCVIRTGATNRDGLNGNMVVNGYLQVTSNFSARGTITGNNGLTITGATNLQNTNINGNLTVDKINGHKIRHARSRVIGVSANATSVTFNDPDAMNYNCIFLEIQDVPLGVLGTTLYRENGNIKVDFINKPGRAINIRFNYILFNQDD